MANKRGTTWHRVAFAGSSLAAGQGISNLLQNLPVTEGVGCTIIRILHQVRYSVALGQGSDGAALISIGIGIVSEESFNASVVPDPNSNIDEPPGGWMLRTVGECHIRFDANSAVETTFDTHLDLRAQRKLGRAVLMHAVNNDSLTGTPAVIQSGLVSVLCMNP